jgi:hypothetical protein
MYMVSGGSSYGFFSCANLANCNGTGRRGGNGGDGDDDPDGGRAGDGGYSCGFSGCTNLINCIGSSGPGGSAGSAGSAGFVGYSYGFHNCRTGFGCKKGTASTTATFGSCYMQQSTGNQVWANTAAGGYNLA